MSGNYPNPDLKTVGLPDVTLDRQIVFHNGTNMRR